ncbi:MAG: hypothetical protein ICV73_27895 [Acetobacteraceae bacterium]|nr:hypothetical protein [Acetobacteraceae bacterium]
MPPRPAPDQVRVWMFSDPLCPHSAAGKVQLALAPVPMLDPTGSGPNTAAALAPLGGCAACSRGRT